MYLSIQLVLHTLKAIFEKQKNHFVFIHLFILVILVGCDYVFNRNLKIVFTVLVLVRYHGQPLYSFNTFYYGFICCFIYCFICWCSLFITQCYHLQILKTALSRAGGLVRLFVVNKINILYLLTKKLNKMKKSDIRLAVENIVGREAKYVYIDKRKNGYRLKFCGLKENLTDIQINKIKSLPFVHKIETYRNVCDVRDFYGGLVVYVTKRPRDIKIENVKLKF